MKPNEHKWRVVRKGNGKYYPQVCCEHTSPYWPWSPGEFVTFESAKAALIIQKEKMEQIARENEEVVVFEL